MEAGKRIKGRFASAVEAGEEAGAQAAKTGSGRALRPTQCRSFAQKRMAQAFPEIVDRFIEEAKLGSIAHAKALAAMSGMDQKEVGGEGARVVKRRRRRPSLTEIPMQELKRGVADDGVGLAGS